MKCTSIKTTSKTDTDFLSYVITVIDLGCCFTAGDGPTLKAVMHLVDEGIEHALEERSKPWGIAREGALLAALRVLVTALQTDGWLLQELRQYPKSGEQIEWSAQTPCYVTLNLGCF